MNRAIKFRAYLTDSESITYSNGNHMEYDVTIVDGKYADVESGWDIHGTYDYPLMQFTGLTDKNGKEIYEGDFIRMKQVTWSYAEHLMQVQWSEEYASFQAMVISTVGHLDGTAKVGTPYSMSVAAKHGEVIGNVFENPELLTV